MLSRGNKAVRLTRDHKPHVESERQRIVSRGGLVNQTDEGQWRVMLTGKANNGQFKWTGLTTSRQVSTTFHRLLPSSPLLSALLFLHPPSFLLTSHTVTPFPLPPSRGLGDPGFKENQLIIICEPDVTSVELQAAADAFSIQVGPWGRTE